MADDLFRGLRPAWTRRGGDWLLADARKTGASGGTLPDFLEKTVAD
jgi:hypothetical protein